MAGDRRARVLLAACVMVACSAALLQAQGITPEQVVQLRQVTTVALSPGGERVAYTIQNPRGEEEDVGPAYSELWVVPAAGGEPRPVVTRPQSAFAPAWTTDGATLAFVANLPQHSAPQVYGVPADGGEPRLLTRSPTGVIAFEFAPDGGRIAYTSREPLSEEVQERRSRGFDMIVWGEDVRHTRLWVERTGSDDRRALTPADRSVRSFAWSPDGGRFALQMTDEVSEDADLMFRSIYTVPATGGDLGLLTPTEGKLGPMAWSPDGRLLAFLGAVTLSDPLAQSVFVVPAEGGAAVNRTPDYEASAEWIGWQDDETVLFVAVEGTRTALNRIGAERGGIERVSGADTEIFRSISLDEARLTFAAPASTRMHPNEVHVASMRSPELRRLTDHNAWLADVTLGQQETIEWTGADGLPMQGVLIRPVGATPGARYPLAVLPHGGPEAISVDGWNTRPLYPVQVLAANGYVVFKPNYRGSGGRGVAFASANHRDLGGKEFDDVLLGIEHLAEQGLIDPQRVGISGTSYGGYFSALAGTRHTDRFAAAITFAGLSNWISFTGTTDIPYEMTLVHWDQWWFDNPGQNWDRSPVAWVTQARTPTLVATGLADERVHPEQALQLHQFLRLQDVPTELVLYPREPHGLRERAHQLDFMNRVLDWFNRYLTQAPGQD